MPQSNSTPAASARVARRYSLIAFICVESDEAEPLTYEEALAEKEQLELMCPENVYRIEEIGEEQNVCTKGDCRHA